MSETCSKQTIIGEGSYGVVYKGEWKGQPCAIKQFKKHPDIYWKQEIDALRAVQGHPNILLFLTSRKFEIVTPLYHSSLSSWHAKQVPLSISSLSHTKQVQIKSFLKQLVSAIVYSHQKQVVHGDIALRNIYLDETETKLVLGDWGAAEVISSDLDKVYFEKQKKQDWKELAFLCAKLFNVSWEIVTSAKLDIDVLGQDGLDFIHMLLATSTQKIRWWKLINHPFLNPLTDLAKSSVHTLTSFVVSRN